MITTQWFLSIHTDCFQEPHEYQNLIYKMADSSYKMVCVCVLVMSDSLEPMDCSLPGFSVHGILQARIIFFSRGSSQARDQTWVSHIQVDSLLSEPPEKPIKWHSVYI